jgi:putative spermidine/putrescine transport system permease protein
MVALNLPRRGRRDRPGRSRAPWGRRLILALAALYFGVPLLAAFWFSIYNDHTGFTFHAYTGFFGADGFAAAFETTLLLAVVTVAVTLVLMVPTMLVLHLRLPKWRPVVELLSLLPLVIPPVALVVGVRDVLTWASRDQFDGTWISWVKNNLQTPQPWILALEYVVLALPFTYRALDAGFQSNPITTLVEAARNLGASWPTVLLRVVLPSLRTAVLNAALLAFALVLGEYTMAKILLFPTYPVWLTRFGDTDGQLQVGLGLLSLVLTWLLLVLIAFVARSRQSGARRERRLLRKATS